VSARSPMAACLVGAAIATGCGGDEPESEKERYEREFNSIVERGERLPQLSFEDDAPVREKIAVMQAARKRMIAMMGEFERLDAPPEVADAHRAWAGGAKRYVVSEFDELLRAFVTRGERAAEKVIGPEPEDYATIERIRAARQELKAKGYDLGDVSEVPR
jgi:hypothetical protein